MRRTSRLVARSAIGIIQVDHENVGRWFGCSELGDKCNNDAQVALSSYGTSGMDSCHEEEEYWGCEL